MSILEDIFAHKQIEVKRARQRIPTVELEAQASQAHIPLDFATALTNKDLPVPRLIAEVKYRSPSKGVFRRDFDPISLATSYAENGAAAISVLTDETYFGGHLETLRQIDALDLGLPMLRKDFIFDPYQVLEARVYGASAVILIVAMLTKSELVALIEKTYAFHLTPLVEVHNEGEMSQAVDAGANIIGINNRDLRDFSVDLDVSVRLASKCPAGKVLVAESGIKTRTDVQKLADAGIDAILVGESLVRAQDIGEQMRSLSGVSS